MGALDMWCRTWPLRALRRSAPLKISYSPKEYPFSVDGALDEHGKVPSTPYDRSPLLVCPLFAELQSRSREGGSLEGYGLAFSQGSVEKPAKDAPPGLSPWDPHAPKQKRTVPNGTTEKEKFLLYVYKPPGRFAIYPQKLSLNELPSGQVMRTVLDDMLSKPASILDNEAHIYVCTHGTRDCRCGVAGDQLLHALRSKVKENNTECAAKGTKPAKQVKIFPVSHVGAHKFAANALIYPHGDWYGNLRVTDVPLLLRAALAPASPRHDLHDLRERLVVWPRWRGRLGLSSLEQREHMSIWGPSLVYSAQLKPRARLGTPEPTPKEVPVSDTAIPLRFRSFEGEWFDATGVLGESLMQVAKRHDLPGIEATCEGELECATCHAYLCDALPGDAMGRGDVDNMPKDADQLFGPISDEEDDMLEYALRLKPSSRLTCQVRVTRDVAAWMRRGGRVELPQY
ncbi:lipoyl synthase [Malassezia vespertilionis]|uniref:lipoyl synthase n=1 Tax=Malassezia vespertilionis TaxID=2020962 RepID=UPI0024B222E4|nr:lipoyl synthase [Malassezia vespertilionis]WFD05130.1 lipoyl synthase [Malassezia vespertilionis]